MTKKFLSNEATTLVAFLYESLHEAYSKKKIKQALEKKGCRVNGRLETFASRKLKRGDEVEFDPSSLEKVKYHILFEDDAMVAIDKPPFLVVAPENFPNLHIVHRLDKETSGVMLLAKHPEAAKGLEKLFYDRKMNKVYHAIVKGKPKKMSGVIDVPLYMVSKSKGKKVLGVKGSGEPLKAQTSYRIVKELGSNWLVECYPKSGRTHQIRVHLESIGLSILGDSQYGSAKEKASRMMLHCSQLSFIHPLTNESLVIDSKWPQDFKACVASKT